MKYGVKVMFTYSVEPDERKFYEEVIYLVNADSFDEAYEKVEKYVNEFDFDHFNPKGQMVKRTKIDFLDCFLAIDEEESVQEVYSSITKNITALNDEEFYKAITNQCDADEMFDLRYQEFNAGVDEEK